MLCLWGVCVGVICNLHLKGWYADLFVFDVPKPCWPPWPQNADRGRPIGKRIAPKFAPVY
jgi:hypothetical protein